jgi:Tfp pilus assembly protein PilN
MSIKGFGGLMERIRQSGVSGIPAEVKVAAVMAAVYTVILIAGSWYLDGMKAEKLAEVDAQIKAVDSKLTLLASELAKTQGYEQTKKSLESDDKKIRTKIETIQELIRDRSTPPKILMALSDSIPKEVWLREFSLKERSFKITGSATSMDGVSDFMKGLSETIYFKDVTLKGSKTATTKGSRETAEFELEAQRR